jgi:LPXTG-site transpeptidase (sortase) family protein
MKTLAILIMTAMLMTAIPQTILAKHYTGGFTITRLPDKPVQPVSTTEPPRIVNGTGYQSTPDPNSYAGFLDRMAHYTPPVRSMYDSYTEVPIATVVPVYTDSPIPTEIPTVAPTDSPMPTVEPTIAPTDSPIPTEVPTIVPTATQVPPTVKPLPVNVAPTKLSIPSIKLTASIVPVKADNGAMGTTDKRWTVGWYGVKAGDVGNAVLDGHVDSAKFGKEVFFNLTKLKKGDKIIIDDKLTFVVTNVKVLNRDDTTNLQSIFGDSDTQNLNLITCTGQFNTKAHTHNKRLVVYATLEHPFKVKNTSATNIQVVKLPKTGRND